jgi:hypothetical protein
VRDVLKNGAHDYFLALIISSSLVDAVDRVGESSVTRVSDERETLN